jgi:hypothetical protein
MSARDCAAELDAWGYVLGAMCLGLDAWGYVLGARRSGLTSDDNRRGVCDTVASLRLHLVWRK